MRSKFIPFSRKSCFVAGVSFLVLMGLVLWLGFPSPSEPSYKGRMLSQWVGAVRKALNDPDPEVRAIAKEYLKQLDPHLN